MMPEETFGAYVKAGREAAGMSQDELAEIVGLSKPQISRIENGHQGTTAINARKICKAINVDIVRGLILLSMVGEETDEMPVQRIYPDQVYDVVADGREEMYRGSLTVPGVKAMKELLQSAKPVTGEVPSKG